MAFLVHEFLQDTAAAAPERTALVAGERRCGFARLDRDSDRAARALQDAGVGRGDRVAVMLENGIDFVTAFFAVSKAGAVHVPVGPSTPPDKLAFILNDCGVRAMVAPSALAARTVLPALANGPAAPDVLWAGGPVPAGAPGRSWGDALASGTAHRVVGAIDQDLAVIAYTSGTTGRPKGVMLTHANLVSTTRSIARCLRNTPDDVVLGALPLTFGYGLSQVLTGALVGFTVVLERSFAFPRETLARMVAHRVTGLPGVPTLFATLLALPELAAADLSALRYLTNAAAPLPMAHLRRLVERFPDAALFSMYGATECSTRISCLDPALLPAKPGSVGRAIPNCETVVLGEDGRPAAAGTVGELAVRGANVMRGYWNRPEETARCLRDGWYHTGDLFTADDEGFLTFVGRRDDVFKCRGEKVAPREVEAVLYELDGVAEAAVAGVPDPVDGMAVRAFIVPRAGAQLSEAAILRHCRGRLEGHQVPRTVVFRDALPKTDTGKVRRFLLAETA